MESNEKEIKQFDSLESTSGPLDEELLAIQKVDRLMSGVSLKSPSSDFTARVMMSAMLARKRRANIRIMSWLLAVFALVAVLSFWFFPFGNEVTLPEQTVQVYERMTSYLGYLTDPKVKQFLLVLEGIVCLMILEKVLSRFGAMKHST